MESYDCSYKSIGISTCSKQLKYLGDMNEKQSEEVMRQIRHFSQIPNSIVLHDEVSRSVRSVYRYPTHNDGLAGINLGFFNTLYILFHNSHRNRNKYSFQHSP